MKIDAIARTADCPESEIFDLLEYYKMIEGTKTGELSPEGNPYVQFKVTDLGQFFCDKVLDDVFEVEWHADKLFKLNDFKEYLQEAAN